MSDRLQDIAAFPADRAWFCEHCETVANRQICPYCLGNGFPLSAWLNRSVKDEVLDPRAQAEMLHSASGGVEYVLSGDALRQFLEREP